MCKCIDNGYMAIALLLIGLSEKFFQFWKADIMSNAPTPAIKILHRQKPVCRCNFGNTASDTCMLTYQDGLQLSQKDI